MMIYQCEMAILSMFLGRDKQLPISDLDNTVYVFGQVQKPGIIPFTRNMTVLRAIINAGNLTKEAAPGRTSVKRYDDGKIQNLNVEPGSSNERWR